MRSVEADKKKGSTDVSTMHKSAVFRIRTQFNPDPAKTLNPDPNPEDPES